MADLNPMVPGDVPYPQYSVTTTEEINATVTILKGVIYTKNAAGNLVVAGTDLSNGIFQAAATPEIAPAVDGDEVQVLGPRTRMIFDDTVGSLVVGEDVITSPNTTNVVSGAKTATNYIGKVFEIYTRNTDSTKKKVTVSGDKVIVETVQP